MSRMLRIDNNGSVLYSMVSWCMIVSCCIMLKIYVTWELVRILMWVAVVAGFEINADVGTIIDFTIFDANRLTFPHVNILKPFIQSKD